MPAHALDEIRKESEHRYKRQLKKCLFKPLTLKIMSKAREMQSSGEVTLRHNVVNIRSSNFVEETQNLLKEIQSYSAAA